MPKMPLYQIRERKYRPGTFDVNIKSRSSKGYTAFGTIANYRGESTNMKVQKSFTTWFQGWKPLGFKKK